MKPLTSARPYKPAWPFAQARSAMEAGCGSHFDPACVAALFRDEAALHAIRQRYDDHHPSPQQLKEAA